MNGELFPDIDRPQKKQKTPESGFLQFPATYDAAPIQGGSVTGAMFTNCTACIGTAGDCQCLKQTEDDGRPWNTTKDDNF